MSAALEQPGLEALRKERAARRVAERGARQALEHAADVEAGAAVLRQRIAAAEAETQRFRASSNKWMERAKLNGQAVRRFKARARRYEALYHHITSKTEQREDRP